DTVEEDVEVVDGVDRDADLADLGLGDRMVGAVAALRGKVEGDRETRLAAREVGAVEGVRLPDVRVARVGAEDPGLVAGGLPFLVEQHVCPACHGSTPTTAPIVQATSSPGNPPARHRAACGSA